MLEEHAVVQVQMRGHEKPLDSGGHMIGERVSFSLFTRMKTVRISKVLDFGGCICTNFHQSAEGARHTITAKQEEQGQRKGIRKERTDLTANTGQSR